ncbi:uncharacterized protein J3R85_020448 [Psidium guajava]|nr:uncharacterized protein J3R85_020448 [Psidium guajava]
MLSLTNKAPEYPNENSQVIEAGLESSWTRFVHSQFPSILHSIPESSHSLHLGAFLRPMSSILGSAAVPCINGVSHISKRDREESNKRSVKRLKVLQLLRTLIHFSYDGCGSEIDLGNEDGINFQQPHSFVLYSYGPTLG